MTMILIIITRQTVTKRHQNVSGKTSVELPSGQVDLTFQTISVGADNNDIYVITAVRSRYHFTESLQVLFLLLDSSKIKLLYLGNLNLNFSPF